MFTVLVIYGTDQNSRRIDDIRASCTKVSNLLTTIYTDKRTSIDIPGTVTYILVHRYPELRKPIIKQDDHFISIASTLCNNISKRSP